MHMVQEHTVLRCDVAVVGAGTSGVPAAVAAARSGRNVILLEQESGIGGAMVTGLGFPVCGLFECNTKQPARLINEGLAKEFYEAVLAEDAHAVERVGRTYVLRCSVGRFCAIYRDWLQRESRIQLITGCSGLTVQEQDQRISRLGFRDAHGDEFRVEEKVVIDCSGNAVLARNSSAKCIEPETPALAGFVFRVSGVAQDDLLSIKVPYVLRKAVDAGTLPDYCRFTVYLPGAPGSGSCKMSMPSDADDALAEQVAERIFDVLRNKLPEFRAAQRTETSKSILQREGIRIKGEYLLTQEDVRLGRKFEDSVARGVWPMEFWDAEKGPRYSYVTGDSTYDIPLRALKSENIGNLWAAGRAISADSAALASARVIGTSIATGESAGLAAAKEAV